MNVAITRARNYLWVVGHAETLKGNHNWRAFVEHWEGKGRVIGFGSRSEAGTGEVFGKSEGEWKEEKEGWKKKIEWAWEKDGKERKREKKWMEKKEGEEDRQE
jgi:hypothetical protein